MKRNKNIEVLRALAISYMLLYHYMQSVPGIVTNNEKGIWVESLGQFALIGFFVLSGFGTYLSFYHMEENGGKPRFVPYIKRRIGAIIPQYYFCMAFVLLLTTGIGYLSRNHVWHILESLFLLQNFDVNNGINGVTWTIGVLFQLYLIAIPLYNCVKKYGFLSWGIGAIICIGIKRLMFWYIAANQLNSIYYVVSSIRIPFTTFELILIGMCAAKLCLNMDARYISVKKRGGMVLISIALLVSYHVIFYKGTIQIGLLYDNRWISCIWQSAIGVYIAMFCVSIYFLPFTYKTLVGKCIQFVAEHEYGIYLWHMILMGNIMTFQPEWYIWLINNIPFIAVGVIFFMAVFIGWISTELTKGAPYRNIYAIINRT